MKSFTYTITDPAGMHARPAGLFTKEAAKFTSTITLEKDGKSADAKRIFGVMGLGIKQGQQVIVNVEGEDEDKAAATLEAFMKENL